MATRTPIILYRRDGPDLMSQWTCTHWPAVHDILMRGGHAPSKLYYKSLGPLSIRLKIEVAYISWEKLYNE